MKRRRLSRDPRREIAGSFMGRALRFVPSMEISDIPTSSPPLSEETSDPQDTPLHRKESVLRRSPRRKSKRRGVSNVKKCMLACASSRVQHSVANLLSMLMHHKENRGVFNRPVDTVALSIPDYYDIIDNPIDLGTIQERLER